MKTVDVISNTRRQTQADKNRETFSRLQVGESFTLHTLAHNSLFCAGHFQKVGENRVSDWTDRRQWSSEDAGIFGEHLILSPATAYSVVPYIVD